MADKKISQLTQAITPLSGGELVPIVQNGETVKVNVGNLRADTSEFVEKTGDTMTGALTINATGTALSVPNGNVGIGTAAPSEKLEVNGNVKIESGNLFIGNNKGVRLANTSGGTTATFFCGGDNTLILGDITGGVYGDLKLFAGGQESLRIKHTNSNVGINTSTPQAKLEVNGDLRTNSLLEKSKNGSVSGGSYFLDWNAYGNHDIILTQNTEILQGDIPPVGYSQVITLNVIGDFALTLPVEWVIKNGGVYDGVNGSQIVVQSWDNGNFYTVIN